MGTLDRLINHQEEKIDHLMQLRRQYAGGATDDLPERAIAHPANIDHDIEKAYEELTIYKIRKMMGHC
ncbi:MAG: hypothetical protein EA408_08595 [Marinilabiliales bacterium]|nr:MAG: hypothetical protein EA408_08595 [Marinilabiliales bacterium]